MIRSTLPLLLGLVLLITFPFISQSQDLELSGSGAITDTLVDTEDGDVIEDGDVTEGSGSVVDIAVVDVSTQRPSTSTQIIPRRVSTSVILPDDEDENPVVSVVEGSAEGSAVGQEIKTVTETMEIGGSGSVVECTSDNTWCWCLDEHGNEMPGTMRKFGRSELEASNCLPEPIPMPTRPTTKSTTLTKTTAISPAAVTAGQLPDRMECDSETHYCWCRDIYGNVMEETRMYAYGTVFGPYLRCPLGKTTPALTTERKMESTTPTTPTLPERMVCGTSKLYCWCVDLYGNEIENTRVYMSPDTRIGPDVRCPLVTATPKPASTEATTTLSPVVGFQNPKLMVCDKDGDFCWCLDAFGNEVPNTRVAMYGRPLSPSMTCKDPIDDPVLLGGRSSTVSKDTDITIVAEETTTMKTRKTTPYIPPFNIDDINSKTDKPVRPSKDEDKKPSEDDEEIGQGAGKGGRNGVDKTDLPPNYPFFTHPGILAAIIGGGVVALLSAMLLIMFIVYRMRKKDEGSYPLDPDAKPPRLHTYTRAPNKEFYA